MLACIPRVRNAIAEVEVEGFQQPILEEMSLNHSKVFHVLVANLKLDAKRKEEARKGSRLKTRHFTRQGLKG